MNRKVLEVALLLKIAVRTLAVVILFGLGITKMPTVILVSSSILAVLGGATLVRSKIMERTLKEFNAYFAIETFVIIFNMVFMAMFSPLTVGFVDTLLVGTVLDIVVNIALFAYGVKQHKYAIITEKKEVEKVRRTAKSYVRPMENLQIR